MSQENLLFRWYFGGLAGAGAVLVTHPMDLVKVHLSNEKPNQPGFISHTKQLVEKGGLRVLYRGVPVAVMRQIVFNTPTFGLYQVAKRWVAPPSGAGIPYWERTGLAAGSGCVGGLLGTPLENLTVRMQMEARLAKADRTSYRNIWDSLSKIIGSGGIRNLFYDCGWTAGRKSLVAVGGMGGYDQIKLCALHYGAEEGVSTHALCGLSAGVTATLCEIIAARLRGGLGSRLFRPFLHSFLRLGPQTSITFVFLEQLRLNYGYLIK